MVVCSCQPPIHRQQKNKITHTQISPPIMFKSPHYCQTQCHIINMPTGIIGEIIKMILKDEYLIIDVKKPIINLFIWCSSLYKDYNDIGKETIYRLTLVTIKENCREKETNTLKTVGDFLVKNNEITKTTKENLSYLSEQEFWRSLSLTDEKRNYRSWIFVFQKYYNKLTQDQLRYIDYWVNNLLKERYSPTSPFSSPLDLI